VEHRRIDAILFIILFLCFTMGCSSGDEGVETINVGVLPDQDDAKLHHIYQPLLDHFNTETGINFTLKIPASYEQLLHWFNNRTIDLALFGGATYVKAHRESAAIPLVLRNIDKRFTSVFLVPASSTAETIQDLKNQSFAFGAPLSTSGHLMPRHFLKKQNIVPETFFSEVKYSGSHDETARWVRNGKVVGGVCNSEVIHQMYLDGKLSLRNTRILWESPLYANYVWAIQPYIEESLRARILEVFLLLDGRDSSQSELLRNLSAGYFLPASHKDFLDLEQTMLEAEMGVRQ
jgi:phosphonate transport system substrate-binding protein